MRGDEPMRGVVKRTRLREMVEVEEVGFEGGMFNCSCQDENVAISRSMRRLHAIFFKYQSPPAFR